VPVNSTAIWILAIRLTLIYLLSIFSLLHDVQEVQLGVQFVLKMAGSITSPQPVQRTPAMSI